MFNLLKILIKFVVNIEFSKNFDKIKIITSFHIGNSLNILTNSLKILIKFVKNVNKIY